MPLHEYLCRKCSHRFERIQKFSDLPIKKCPECGGRVDQLLSAPAVQFKGTGWYATDYGKKSGSPDGANQRDGAQSSAQDGAQNKNSDNSSEKPAGQKSGETESRSGQDGTTKSSEQADSRAKPGERTARESSSGRGSSGEKGSAESQSKESQSKSSETQPSAGRRSRRR